MYLGEWLMQTGPFGLPIALLISYLTIASILTFVGYWIYTRTRYQWYYYVIALVAFALFVNNVLHVHIPLITEFVEGLTGGGGK